MIQEKVEKIPRWGTEKPLCSGGSIGPLEEIVMHGGECLQARGGDVMQAMMAQGELPVSSLHTRTGALEQVRTIADHSLHGCVLLHGERGQTSGDLRRVADPLSLFVDRSTGLRGAGLFCRLEFRG